MSQVEPPFSLPHGKKANEKDVVEATEVTDVTFDKEAHKTEGAYGHSGYKGLLHNAFVVRLVVLSGLGMFLYGYNQGMMAIILVMPRFLQTFPEIDAAQNSSAAFNKGLMTAMLELGASVGAFSSGYCADRLSRKRSCILAVSCFLVGTIIQCSSYTYAQLTVGRTIGGLGIGSFSILVPLYTSEIAPPKIRGALVAFHGWAVIIGIFFSFWITYGTRYIDSHWQFRGPFMIQLLPGIVLLGGLFTLPYSPRWLVLKGRGKDALKSLCQVRRLPDTDQRVQAEILEICAEQQVMAEHYDAKYPQLPSSGWRMELIRWKDLLVAPTRRRTVLAVGVWFINQLTGINALLYYGPTLFNAIGVTGDLALIFTGIQNTLLTAFSIIGILTMDTVGRRFLMLLGTAHQFIVLLILSILIGLYHSNWSSHVAAGRVCVAMMWMFMIAQSFTLGLAPYVITNEIFPTRHRSRGAGFTLGWEWIANFIVGLVTPPLQQAAPYGSFALFCACMFVGFIFVYFRLPETKGLSLEEIDKCFGSYVGAEDDHRRLEIEDLLIAELRATWQLSSKTA